MIKGSSLPVPIKSAYSYIFKGTDNRTKSLVSTKDKKTVTGIKCSCHRLPTVDHTDEGPLNSVLKILKDDDSGSEAEDDYYGDDELHGTDDKPETSSKLNYAIKWHLNWRCSFRTKEPERPKRDKIQKLLEQRHKRFGAVLPHLPIAQRHAKPDEEKQHITAENKKVRLQKRQHNRADAKQSRLDNKIVAAADHAE